MKIFKNVNDLKYSRFQEKKSQFKIPEQHR